MKDKNRKRHMNPILLEKEPDTDDNDEAEQEARVVIHSDSWDNIGFGLYPIRY